MNEVWVFFYAEQGQKEAVGKAVSELPYRHNIHIVPLTVARFFQKKMYRIRYEIWQWRAYQVARRLIEEVEIDLIHHVTIAAWWNCGHLWRLNVPFIFGPISGAQQVPQVAYPFLRFSDRLCEWIRTLIFNISWRIWQRPRRAIKKAKLVLVDNPETEEKVRQIRKSDPVLLISDGGVDAVKEKDNNFYKAKKGINLFWSGLLMPRKNFGLLLESVAKLPANIIWSLRVAGDGRLFNYWKRGVESYGLQRQISFLGRIDYPHMSEQYRWADVFVFPSLREATGTVLVEAMSYGLPVIALNIHGARYILDENCAFLVSVMNKEQMVEDFRNAIIELYSNPELGEKMGEAGRERVKQHYLWQKRGEQMNQIYAQVLKNEPMS